MQNCEMVKESTTDVSAPIALPSISESLPLTEPGSARDIAKGTYRQVTSMYDVSMTITWIQEVCNLQQNKLKPSGRQKRYKYT